MPKINCSHCGKEYDIDLQMEGRKAKCSACKEIFTVNFDVVKEMDKENIKKEYVKEDDLNIKPNKFSYLLLGNPWMIVLLIITLFISIISIIGGLIFFIFPLIYYFWIRVKYKKEKYIITDRKIIYTYGNLFSDNTVEVNLDKITQVISVLGFVQFNIFKTGNLLVKTAGSSSSKINLKNIENTMELYENIQSRMRKNGFHLQKDKLVQSAKPHWLGIIGEVIGKIFASIFVIFIAIGDMFSQLEEGELSSIEDFGFYFYIIGFIYLILIIFILIFSFLDLKRRQYDVFTDSIFYTEGFLTKHFSFLPMESVADTENIQSFWSKVFGLHDVVVSSEGSENKVIFKNMVGGDTMMKNIKYLKDNIIMGENDALRGAEKNVDSLIGFKNKMEKPLDYDKSFKGEYKMSMLKSLLITIPLLIYPPIFVIVFISQIIKVSFTRFIVEESSIEKKFEFLSNQHNAFSIEKITGMKITKSILDRILGTCSISFWSIGSSKAIVFSNIKNTENLEKKLMSKIGIKLVEPASDIPVNFNFLDYLKSSIGAVIFFVFLFLVLFVFSLFIPEFGLIGFTGFFILFLILLFLIYVYKIFYYNKSRYIQKLHTHFIESISGIILVTKSYVLFRNIKGIKSKKYPLTETGSISINVAGEQIVQSKNKQTISILSNSVNIAFVDKVFNVHNSIDSTLNEGEIDQTLVFSSKQDVGNSIIYYVIFYLFILLLGTGIPQNETFSFGFFAVVITIIFLLIVGLIVWYIKVKLYNFEKDRVKYMSGIVYRSKHTILYNKFNFIEKNQGFINKIFKNGIVKIYTLGSGKVEMKLNDASDYKKIYELLEKD